MNKYAVLIGNSQFPDEADKSKLPDLTCPEKDVDGLAKVLSSERGEFEVLPLKNKSSYQVLLELQRAINKAQQNDLLLLYYSGHGKPNKAGILHLTTTDTIITALEATAIPINRIYDIIGTSKCKKIIIILDCCYSGAAGQGYKGDLDAQLQQLNNSRGIYLVTSSTGMQVAHESAVDGYSLFTKHLIIGLETGDADIDGDGLVDMDELYKYVHRKVMAENPYQEPTEYTDDKRGDLFIAKSGRDSQKERNKKIEIYFYDLAKEKRISKDILLSVLELLEKPQQQWNPGEQQQFGLIVELFDNQIGAVEFIRKWDRLTFEIEKAIQEVAILEKAEKGKRAQEKLSQEKLSQEKVYPDTANTNSVEEQKTYSIEPKKNGKNYVWVVLVICILILAAMIAIYSQKQSANESRQPILIENKPTKQNKEQQVQQGEAETINGHTSKTARDSLAVVKSSLDAYARSEFEVSFWMLRDINKDEQTFLKLVDGKKPEEIIALGKALYQQRKNTGDKEYEQYSSWEELIDAYMKERIENYKMSQKKDR